MTESSGINLQIGFAWPIATTNTFGIGIPTNIFDCAGTVHMPNGGTGSGDVNRAYTVSIVDGLKKAGLALDGALADAYASYLAEQEKQQPPRQRFAPPPVITGIAPE